MEFFTNDFISGLLEKSLETAALTPDGFKDVGTGSGSKEGRFIKFLTIKNNEESVIEDVNRIADHPVIPASIPVRGSIYDVRSGTLNPIVGAVRNEG